MSIDSLQLDERNRDRIAESQDEDDFVVTLPKQDQKAMATAVKKRKKRKQSKKEESRKPSMSVLQSLRN